LLHCSYFVLFLFPFYRMAQVSLYQKSHRLARESWPIL
jgi:hypothetical protein